MGGSPGSGSGSGPGIWPRASFRYSYSLSTAAPALAAAPAAMASLASSSCACPFSTWSLAFCRSSFLLFSSVRTASASFSDRASSLASSRITWASRVTAPLTEMLATPDTPSSLGDSSPVTKSLSAYTSMSSRDTAATITGSMEGLIFST